MRRSSLGAFVLAFSYLMVSAPCDAVITLRILDAPRHAYSFEPIYVTFEVRNEGQEPVVIPVGHCPHQGTVLEVGPVGEDLYPTYRFSHCSDYRLVWLAPGARWLIFRHIEVGPEGRFKVRAVLRSLSQCKGKPVGPDQGHIEAVRPRVRGSQPYDCWSGEVRSEAIQVSVDIPRSPSDLAFVESLGVERVVSPQTLISSFLNLSRRYPESHYTYAAFQATGGGYSMLNVVILQPENPLNPWVVAAIAEGLAYRDRRCANPESWGPRAPADLDERFERVIAAYPPPEPVRAYLQQLEAELASEECPESGGATEAEEFR